MHFRNLVIKIVRTRQPCINLYFEITYAEIVLMASSGRGVGRESPSYFNKLKVHVCGGEFKFLTGCFKDSLVSDIS